MFPSRASSKGGFERGALESAIDDSLPDERYVLKHVSDIVMGWGEETDGLMCSTATALDRWLQSQKSTNSLRPKNGRLNVVQEEVDE